MLLEIEWHPNGRQLRTFGVSGLLASSAAAPLLYFVWGAALLWAVVVLAVGAALLLCSLISVRITRLLYIGLTLAALPIGFAVSFFLLAAFYFLLLTPLALVFRLIGRDSLCRSWQGQDAIATEEQGQDSLATSYWVPHKSSEDMERYFHQF
jgi:predicted lysophospholipase L1 biosynthesis ABC-type transport system permease subunit